MKFAGPLSLHLLPLLANFLLACQLLASRIRLFIHVAEG